MMTTNLAKQTLKGALLAVVLMLCSGAILPTTAQAQGWRHEHWEHRGGFVVTRRVFVAPRVRVYSYPGYYAYPRVYPYRVYSYTPRYDAGPYDVAYQNGYRDGFNRGSEDARHGRSFDPNNSSHFRDSISSGYRDGFRTGYDQGYRQYAG